MDMHVSVDGESTTQLTPVFGDFLDPGTPRDLVHIIERASKHRYSCCLPHRN